MKKRSMLAVASLAVGVVASLTAPSAHASAVGGQGDLTGPLQQGGVLTTAPGAVQGQVGDAGGVTGDATGYVTGQADGLVGLPAV
ncbi:hypothetical protein [Streptomyces sp. CB01881]|uniref:hypothetical protein n=1 Tax=Streptomyces sp. CB01881 TaxID=2078691 RepID=UPI000CDC5803|nr:hypothetical protein [Streptomyces sp. CB01881]AUY53363.1 hypothetical protein C2142_35710 [Streptomyces sp. CB01881]TYC69515.1 hypothetical protein EH183_35770 [Streptomyces sp. CB01881]